MWAHPCAHVIFDTDPTPRGRTGPAEEEEMSQAMIRSVTDYKSVTLTEWVGWNPEGLIDHHMTTLLLNFVALGHPDWSVSKVCKMHHFEGLTLHIFVFENVWAFLKEFDELSYNRSTKNGTYLIQIGWLSGLSKRKCCKFASGHINHPFIS